MSRWNLYRRCLLIYASIHFSLAGRVWDNIIRAPTSRQSISLVVRLKPSFIDICPSQRRRLISTIIKAFQMFEQSVRKPWGDCNTRKFHSRIIEEAKMALINLFNYVDEYIVVAYNPRHNLKPPSPSYSLFPNDARTVYETKHIFSSSY